MKSLKKVLSLLLVVIMTSAVFMGCSSKNNSSQSNGESTKSEERKPEDFKGEIELMVPAGDYIEFMKDNIIPYFEQEYSNVKVTVTSDENLDTRIAAGDAPDVYAGVFGYMPARYAEMGKLANYEQFEGYEELFSQIEENYVIKNFDKLYYVPWNATTQLMIYNKELFKEAGLDPENPPKTFDEFLVAAEKINALPKREDGSEVHGTVFWNDALSWGGWYWTMLSQMYYNMNDGKHQLFNKYGTDIAFDKDEAKMVEFFEFITKAQEFAPATMEKNFFSRNIGMWLQFGYGWKANLDEAEGMPMEIGKDVGVAPIPVLNEGDKHWSTLDGRALMIFKSSSEQEKIAWELVKFLMRDDKNLEACKTLGQLPTLKSLQNDPFFQRDEVKPFVEQLKNTLPNEPIGELDDVANIIQKVYIETVLEKKITPEEAVKKAAEEARKVIKEKSN